MATRDLNIKFKVDASEVLSKSDEAKRKVKQAADDMASEVKSSSESMKQSFEGVAKSTDSIKDATKGATDSVKDMEQQVDSSAKNMEKSIEAVSKKMNVMMGARGAATALRMAGNAVQSIGPTFGISEGAASTTSNILNGAASGIAAGAQLGTVIGGPGMGTALGAAAGGLMGAASELFKAGQELNKAAAVQSKERRDAFKDAVADLNARQEADRINKVNQSFINNLGTASGMDRYTAELDARKKAVTDAQKAYDEYVGQFAYLFDPKWTGEKTALSREEEEQLNKLKDALETAKKSLENFTPVVVAATAAVEEQNENELERKRKTENAVIDAAVADKQKRDRAAYIADLKSAWKADIDSGDFASYRAAGADIKTQFDSAQKALDDFVSAVKKDMDDTGRNSTLEESATIVQLKSAVDSAQELLRAFSEVEKYAKDKEEKSLAGSQDKLNGSGFRTVSAPTDQLTRIGGGSGYASYNNSVSSVEQVQKSIDNSVKTLIANQNSQNNQIIGELRDIKLSNTDAKFG